MKAAKDVESWARSSLAATLAVAGADGRSVDERRCLSTRGRRPSALRGGRRGVPSARVLNATASTSTSSPSSSTTA